MSTPTQWEKDRILVCGTNGMPVYSKASGYGIQTDPASPTFGFKDLVGAVQTRSPSTEPTFTLYNGTIAAWRFPTAAGVKEIFLEFHMPHDYVPGSNIFIHTHWSQNVVDTGGPAGVPGNVKWYWDVTYAKGYGTPGGAARGAFSTVITTSVIQQGSTTQYGHQIAEVQLSATTPSGSQLDSDDLEIDGLILVRCYRNSGDVDDTLDQNPWLHFVDIHYQSTQLATKDKNFPFYT